MIDGVWRYTTSRHILEALKAEHNIDDAAAREWMKKGAALNIPPPTLTIKKTQDDDIT